MTFSDIRHTESKTVVFFPANLGGSLDNALRSEGIEDWAILRVPEAEQTHGIECPRDENGHLSVKLYEDMDLMTNQVRALVSHLDPETVLHRIYSLYTDPDAMSYQHGQAALLTKALREDGMIK